MSTQLIDRAVVAAKIGVKRRFLRENLEKKPGFPKPKKALTQKTVLGLSETLIYGFNETKEK